MFLELDSSKTAEVTFYSIVTIFSVISYFRIKKSVQKYKEKDRNLAEPSNLIISIQAKNTSNNWSDSFNGSDYKLVRFWREDFQKGLLIFTILWNTPIVWTVYEFIKKVMKPSFIIQGDLANFLPYSFYAIMGGSLFYYMLCSAINKTTFSVKNDILSVKKGPLPFFTEDVTLNISEIKQVYIQEYCTGERNHEPVIAYRLIAQVLNHKDVCLDKGIKKYDRAKMIEAWLEEKLGLRNEAVPGEVSA